MNRPLRILMISARFFPYSGGTEVHTREVSTRLARLGHHVTVLTTDPSRKLARFERLDGVDVGRVPAWPSESDLHFAPAVLTHVARGRWDVAHVQGYHTLVPPVAMLGALKAHVPYVVTFHGGGHSSRVRQSVRGLQRKLLSPLLRRAARLIALAEFELELFGDQLGIPRSRFVIIPTGTDLPKIDRVPPASERQALIASIGRLERYKGHHRVIAALPWVLKEEPQARLWVAGSGPYERKLRELADRVGVAERVDIHSVPSTDRQAMARELANVGVVALMSEYETQPAAVLEGLAMGCPAVVADTSGLSELARHGLARAIPLDSPPAEVARAIVDQLRNPQVPKDLRLPTWDDCTRQLEALYTQVARA